MNIQEKENAASRVRVPRMEERVSENGQAGSGLGEENGKLS